MKELILSLSRMGRPTFYLLVPIYFILLTISPGYGNDKIAFEPVVGYTPGIGASSVTMGDFNNDGKLDLAAANYWGYLEPKNIGVFLGIGDGTFGPVTNYASSIYYSEDEPVTLWITTSDLNGDNSLDLIVANYRSRVLPVGIGVLLGIGDGTFEPVRNYESGNGATMVTAGDFNNDGKLDLAVLNGNVGILLQDSSTFDFLPVIEYPAGKGFTGVTKGDLNNDGNLDLAVSSADLIGVLLGKGDGSFESIKFYSSGAGFAVEIIGIVSGDFNNDGRLDLAKANPVNNSVGILLQNPSTFDFLPAVEYISGPNSTGVTTGDLNNDGNLDLAVAGRDGIGVLIGVGDGTFKPVKYFYDIGLTMVFSGDLNNDCKLDLATAKCTTRDICFDSAVDIFLQTDNTPPIVDAGINILANTEEEINIIIVGQASDNESDPLVYRWLEGSLELSEWQNVDLNGSAELNLNTLPAFNIGQHVFTLEVYDGIDISTDQMIYTVSNSAPHIAPTGGGTYEIFSSVFLRGQISDFDGDLLTYQWVSEGSIISEGQIDAVRGGAPVNLPDISTTFNSIGLKEIILKVSDGVNLTPVFSSINIEIIDSTAPTLAPVPDKSILWPINHQMLDIYIQANASDNDGKSVTLNASVSSNEPEEGLEEGDIPNDWTQPTINQTTGEISLKLRAERSGRGSGRVYTIAIIATDQSSNTSSANVKITVPHDNRKK